jgi:hypothetical protein
MNKSEKSILQAFFGKTLNLTAEDVAPIFETKGDDEELKEDALKFLLGHDATRIKTIKDEVATSEKTGFDKGYKKAQAEVLPGLEKKIKEKFNIDSDKQGLELIEELVAAKANANVLEEDKVKVHPAFLKREKELLKQIEDEKTALEKKFKDREDEIANEKTFSEIVGLSDKTLEALKPVLPKDAEKAKNQKQLLINELKGFKYEKQGDQIVILNADGKRLEDDHGKPVSFDSLIKNTASKYWDFEVNQQRQGSGANNDNQNNGNAASNTYKGTVPTNDAEFTKAFNAASSKEERVAMLNAYEAQQKV